MENNKNNQTWVDKQKFIDRTLNDKITLMNSVHRQATINTINHENIAQHSFFVAFYALKISQELKLDCNLQNEIVVKALIHDIGESSTSDVPSNVKHKLPQLKELLDQAEDFAVEKYFPEIIKQFRELRQDEKDKNISGTIVKLADILAFIQTCKTEEELGNHSITLEKAKQKSLKNLYHYLVQLKSNLKDKNNLE